MEEKDLLHNPLQGNENIFENQSNSVDDLLRQKLANRLRSRKKRRKSEGSDSSSVGCSLLDSPVENFDENYLSCSNSDISIDERLERIEERGERDGTALMLDIPSDEDNRRSLHRENLNNDCDITFTETYEHKKRRFNSNIGNSISQNLQIQNHVKNILFSQPDWQEKDFETRQDRRGSFEYLNEILDSYLILPIAVEKLQECHIDCSYSIKSLHKGLCNEWSSTGICSNENCAWSHESKILFQKKFSTFSTLNIISTLLYAPKVKFHEEILIEGFQELVRREVPDKWIGRLMFYLFTKTESLEPSFLEFWIIVARYFCNVKNVDNLSYGFVELLNIFSNVNLEGRWKVFKFLELIKEPPINLHLSHRILKPILHFEIFPCLLLEVIENCNDTRVDVVETYLEIVPKIHIKDLPLKGVETLLKFSEILLMFNASYSEDLKNKLENKVEMLPSDLDEEEYPLTHSHKFKHFRKAEIEEENSYQTFIKNIQSQCEENFNFELFASSINNIKLEFVEKAAIDIMSFVFSKTLSSEDAINLIQAAILNSKNRSSELITSTVATSLIYDYVTSQDWKTACSILTVCCNKNISLPYAKIVKRDLTLETKMTQAKLAFFLAEIYLNNQRYEEFVTFLERYNLLHVSFRNWSVDFVKKDHRVKIQLVDKFFASAFSEDATDIAYQFFSKIDKNQNESQTSIDLRLYVSELIISLINQGNEKLVEEIQKKFFNKLQLKPIAVRSLVAFLVQKNQIEEAKTFFTYYAQIVYKIPSVIKSSKDSPFILRISSTLSDEELYILFEYLFAKMMKYKFSPQNVNKTTPEDCKVIITINVVNLEHDSNVKPWYLMEVDNTDDAIRQRIENLLEKKLVPPIKTFNMSKSTFLDYESVHKHLLNRFSNVTKL